MADYTSTFGITPYPPTDDKVKRRQFYDDYLQQKYPRPDLGMKEGESLDDYLQRTIVNPLSAAGAEKTGSAIATVPSVMAQEFEPGVKAQSDVDEWLTGNVVEPAAKLGFPNVGAALATVPSTLTDAQIPQTGFDLAAVITPLPAIRKAIKSGKKLFPQIEKAMRLETKEANTKAYAKAIEALRKDDPDLGSIKIPEEMKVTPGMAKENFAASLENARKSATSNKYKERGFGPTSIETEEWLGKISKLKGNEQQKSVQELLESIRDDEGANLSYVKNWLASRRIPHENPNTGKMYEKSAKEFKPIDPSDVQTMNPRIKNSISKIDQWMQEVNKDTKAKPDLRLAEPPKPIESPKSIEYPLGTTKKSFTIIGDDKEAYEKLLSEKIGNNTYVGSNIHNPIYDSRPKALKSIFQAPGRIDVNTSHIGSGVEYGNPDPLAWVDAQHGVTKDWLQKTKDKPRLIETQSDLIGNDDYIAELNPKDRIVFHINTENPRLNRLLIPGSPSIPRILKAAEKLASQGIDVKIVKNVIPELKKYELGEVAQTAKSKGIKYEERNFPLADDQLDRVRKVLGGTEFNPQETFRQKSGDTLEDQIRNFRANYESKQKESPKPQKIDTPKGPKGDPEASLQFQKIRDSLNVAPSRYDVAGRDASGKVGSYSFTPDEASPMPQFEDVVKRNYNERDFDQVEKTITKVLADPQMADLTPQQKQALADFVRYRYGNNKNMAKEAAFADMLGLKDDPGSIAGLSGKNLADYDMLRQMHKTDDYGIGEKAYGDLNKTFAPDQEIMRKRDPRVQKMMDILHEDQPFGRGDTPAESAQELGRRMYAGRPSAEAEAEKYGKIKEALGKSKINEALGKSKIDEKSIRKKIAEKYGLEDENWSIVDDEADLEFGVSDVSGKKGDLYRITNGDIELEVTGDEYLDIVGGLSGGIPIEDTPFFQKMNRKNKKKGK